MKKSLLTMTILSANLFLIGCADDQARQQIADTNQRLNQLQQNIVVLDNKLTNQKVLDLLNQISDLQNQINQLNGRVAAIEQGQTSGSGNVNQELQSLDMRVAALESSAGVQTNDRPFAAAKVNTSSSNAQLQDAISKIKANDINGAIVELKQVMVSNDKASAASARYYLSVAYVANNQYGEAIAEANKFISIAPNNKNVPDAYRVIFIAQSQSGQTAAANATAKKLIKMFPNSEAAKKVAKQIQ